MKLIAVLGASALLMSFAVSQTAPRAPGGQGGQRQGSSGFRMGGGTRLLLNPAVQKELKMTRAQVDKAQKQFGMSGGPQGGTTRPGGQGGTQGGRQPMTDAQREQRRQEIEKQVKAILDAKQFARYNQLVLQSQGAGALTRKDVAAKVGLSAAQVTKIQDIQQKQMAAMRAQFQRGQQGGAGARPNGTDIRAQFTKMRAETDKKILATLTAAQKQKWNAMLGAPFKFQ